MSRVGDGYRWFVLLFDRFLLFGTVSIHRFSHRASGIGDHGLMDTSFRFGNGIAVKVGPRLEP